MSWERELDTEKPPCRSHSSAGQQWAPSPPELVRWMRSGSSASGAASHCPAWLSHFPASLVAVRCLCQYIFPPSLLVAFCVSTSANLSWLLKLCTRHHACLTVARPCGWFGSGLGLSCCGLYSITPTPDPTRAVTECRAAVSSCL